MVENSDRGVRVLVVDDCPHVRALFELGLHRLGYDVRTAGDGLTALETAVEFRPHAMLIDLALPVLDGWQLAERVSAHPFFKRPMLIAVTGLPLDKHRARSKEVGFTHHLLKPVGLGDIDRLLSAS